MSALHLSKVCACYSLTAQLRVFCATNYYGPQCDVYCRPSDHYDCNWGGQKVCRTGRCVHDCLLRRYWLITTTKVVVRPRQRLTYLLFWWSLYLVGLSLSLLLYRPSSCIFLSFCTCCEWSLYKGIHYPGFTHTHTHVTLLQRLGIALITGTSRT